MYIVGAAGLEPAYSRFQTESTSTCHHAQTIYTKLNLSINTHCRKCWIRTNGLLFPKQTDYQAFPISDNAYYSNILQDAHWVSLKVKFLICSRHPNLAREVGFEPTNDGFKTRCLRPVLAIPQLFF